MQKPPPYSARIFNLAEIEGLSQRAIELHVALYRQHVAEVNRLLAAQREAPGERALPSSRFAFEYNGMVLHELFFEGLTGVLGAIPAQNSTFHAAVKSGFGDLEDWKADLRALAQGRGAGWVLCARERAANRLFNCWVEGHTIGLPVGTDPIVVIDLWEHAWVNDYTLDQRDAYVDTVLAQINWKIVERRCR